MASEIYKLYKKAEVPIKCSPLYPSLSDYQQIELIKILIDRTWIEFAYCRSGDLGSPYYYAGKIDFKSHYESSSFDETIAGLVCKMWPNFSESSKNKIREILGGER